MLGHDMCMGVGSQTTALYMTSSNATWFSLFSGTPTSNATITVPDTGAQVSLGANGELAFKEVATLTTPGAGYDGCQGNSSNHDVECSYNGGSFLHIPQVIASGTATMASGSISGATCAAAVSATATGVLTTDAVEWAYATAPALATDALLIVSVDVHSAGNVSFTRCNTTAGAIVGTAIVINWRVIR
jgi:hypothetical protein